MFQILENSYCYFVDHEFEQLYHDLPSGFDYNMNEDQCIVGIYCEKSDYNKILLIAICKDYLIEQEHIRLENQYCCQIDAQNDREEYEFYFEQWLQHYTGSKDIEKQMEDQYYINRFKEYQINNW
jgi:hypothetical protein